MTEGASSLPKLKGACCSPVPELPASPFPPRLFLPHPCLLPVRRAQAHARPAELAILSLPGLCDASVLSVVNHNLRHLCLYECVITDEQLDAIADSCRFVDPGLSCTSVGHNSALKTSEGQGILFPVSPLPAAITAIPPWHAACPQAARCADAQQHGW